MQGMFALVQQQYAAYDDEPFDVIIGVYTTEEAAKKVAVDMDLAYTVMNGGYINGVKHSVLPITQNTLITDLAQPWKHCHRLYDVTKHFEHLAPGRCGPPPVETEGVLIEYQGRCNIIPGTKANAFWEELKAKLELSLHEKRKIQQLIEYGNEECMETVFKLVKDKGVNLSDLEFKFLKAAYYERRSVL